MKAKVKRGRSFRGALDYAFKQEKRPEIVAGNMSGQTPRALSEEFAAARRLRPDVTRPVLHFSLSLPPDEHIDNDKWEEIASDFLLRMGLSSESQWVAVRHHDTEHNHIHIIVSRIGLDGRVWLGKWEARKAIELTQEFEKKYGLTQTPGLVDTNGQRRRRDRKQLKKEEIEMAIRLGEKPTRLQLQEYIAEALHAATHEAPLPRHDDDIGNSPLFRFLTHLDRYGILYAFNMGAQLIVSGVSFGLSGIMFKGSDLGKEYSWNNLKRVLGYDQKRDGAKLARWAASKRNSIGATGTTAGSGSKTPGSLTCASGAIGAGFATAAGPTSPGGRQDAAAKHRGDVTGRNSESDGRGSREMGGNDKAVEYSGPKSGRGSVGGTDCSGQLQQCSGTYPGSNEKPVMDVANVICGKSATDRIADSLRAASLTACDMKLRAFERQHAALGGPSGYTVTAIDRNPRTMQAVTKKKTDRSHSLCKRKNVDHFSPDDMRRMIGDGTFDKLNAAHYDLHITPISDRLKYVLVRDVKGVVGLEALRAAGYAPALVQQLDDRNFQAVLLVDGLADRHATSRVAAEINAKYGDPTVMSAGVPFPLAGFRNVMPGSGHEFTTVDWGECRAGYCCPKLAANAAAAQEDIDTEERQRLACARADGIAQSTDAGPSGSVRESPNVFYRRRAKAHAAIFEHQNAVDWSAVDFRAVFDMKKAGFLDTAIEAALKSESPSVAARHPDDLDDYVLRTIQAATQHLEQERVEAYSSHNDLHVELA